MRSIKSHSAAAAVFLACVAICHTVLGQLTVLPSEGKSLGSASAPQPGKWIVFATGFMPVSPVLLDGGKSIIWEGVSGEYAVIYFPPGDGQPLVQKVVLGSAAPTPGPGPGPTPPPVPGGKKQVLIVYDQDRLDNLPPDQRAILTSLDYREQLKASGHKLLGIFALQSLGTAESKYKPFLDAVSGQTLPRVVFAPLAGGTVTGIPLPDTFAELEKRLGYEK